MRTLSKSDFKVGMSCSTKLFYKEMGGYASTMDNDPYLQLLAEGGYMIEQLAKARYPDGVEGSRTGDITRDAAATSTTLLARDATIFEATLLNGRRLARVDILQRRGNTLRLIEVKSKSYDSDEDRRRADAGKPSIFWTARKPLAISSDWYEYIADVTYQTMLLESLFPQFRVEPYLCLVDKSAVAGIDRLPEYFTIEREARADGRTKLVTARFTGDADIAKAAPLTVELRVTDEVNSLRADVETTVTGLLTSYEPELHRSKPKIGLKCRDCEYRVKASDIAEGQRNGFAECWGDLASVTPSVLDVYYASLMKDSNGLVAERLIAQRTPGVHDIPDDLVGELSAGSVTAQRQAVQISHTKRGTEFVGPEIRESISGVSYPLHFIDFEAARIAVPFHSGMRPYGLLAFQWSVHTIDAPSAPLRHQEWINTSHDWPNEQFFRSLHAAIGTNGTVLTWSPFEVSTLRNVRDELAARGALSDDLGNWITGLVHDVKGPGPRILDMHKLTKSDYFHPGMQGRTSIKVVLDSLWKSDASMRRQFADIAGREGDPLVGPYASLAPVVIAGVSQSVAEGTGAIRAYEAMMFGAERNDPEVQESWRQLLLEYCKLDTLAMVLIWEYWNRIA